MTPDIREKAERLWQELSEIPSATRDKEIAIISQALAAEHEAGVAEGMNAAALLAVRHADDDPGILADLCQGCGEQIAGAILAAIRNPST